jgi:hypothetical protein
MIWLLALSLLGADNADVTRDSGREQHEMTIGGAVVAEGIKGFPPQSFEGIKGFPPQRLEGIKGFPPQLAEGIKGFPPRNFEGIKGFPPQRTDGEAAGRA